ncbi:MAG: hypothetical protein GTN76_00810 [Candidatus Aenigmarchaeota archaeon]|nr:hypothetical protein [Candidatus Aenigmarchaeota archaeon]
MSTGSKRFFGISQQNEFDIDTMEVMSDHVHIFPSAPLFER